MKKRNTKAALRRKVTKPSNDTALIQECVIYAQSVAAYRDGFKADPDGDMCHASALGEKYMMRTWQAIIKIAATPATTLEGIRAKARIVPVMFESNEHHCLEPRDVNFLKSFADEVEKFLQSPVAEPTPTVPAR